MSKDLPFVCLFLDEHRGDPVKSNLTMDHGYSRLTRFAKTLLGAPCIKVAKKIRPFQLRYRKFDLYLVDVGGYPPYVQAPFMVSLGKVVKGRRSRLFLFWSEATYKPFVAMNPDLEGCSNCINCEDSNADKIARRFLDKVNRVW